MDDETAAGAASMLEVVTVELAPAAPAAGAVAVLVFVCSTSLQSTGMDMLIAPLVGTFLLYADVADLSYAAFS